MCGNGREEAEIVAWLSFYDCCNSMPTRAFKWSGPCRCFENIGRNNLCNHLAMICIVILTNRVSYRQVGHSVGHEQHDKCQLLSTCRNHVVFVMGVIESIGRH